MRKPRTTIEKFSTFLDVQQYSSYNPTWIGIPRLEQNTINKIEELGNKEEDSCAQYWLAQALQDCDRSLAPAHLSAYLEETCYRVAIALVRRVTQSNIDWRDCFQDARAAAAKPGKLFRSYDPTKSSVSSYAQQRLDSAIKDAQIGVVICK
jgi:hypothetical protein